MPIRYMGTKRILAPYVRQAIVTLEPSQPVVDLFSGMGSVATCLAPSFPVITNDLLQFTSAFARCRLLETARRPSRQIVADIYPSYNQQAKHLRKRFCRRLSGEQLYLGGDAGDLLGWMSNAPHVGISKHYSRAAVEASESSGADHYCLMSLYFSAGYFSTSQAIELDALRYAIDDCGHERERDLLLAAWIAAAAIAINAPGHTAQYLKPRNENVLSRIRRQWARSIWGLFVEQLDALTPVGDRAWRRRNHVCVGDALVFLHNSAPNTDIGAIYADPPYTKDQYSRYYHLYETMYRYDFPESLGEGRTRPDLTPSAFCHVSKVQQSFRHLFATAASVGSPLVLSYPSDGLLAKTGTTVEHLAKDYFSTLSVREIRYVHSTMGASSGARSKSTIERIHVCIP